MLGEKIKYPVPFMVADYSDDWTFRFAGKFKIETNFSRTAPALSSNINFSADFYFWHLQLADELYFAIEPLLSHEKS